MVVVVDVPDPDGGWSFVFAAELAGVEEFFGEDALVALDLPVVLGRVGPGALVAGPGSDDSGEVGGSVAGAVVGDDAMNVGNAVGGEPGFGGSSYLRWGRVRHADEADAVM